VNEARNMMDGAMYWPIKRFVPGLGDLSRGITSSLAFQSISTGRLV
jgi:hypothetical protein